MAGGFTFEIGKTEELKNFIKNRLDNKIETFLSINEKEYDLCLDCNDISLKLVQDIELIGPYGAGNHKPKIMIENVSIVNIKPFGKNEEHLRLTVVSNNKYKPTSLIVNVFRVKKEDTIYQVIMKRKKSYSLVGTMSLNHWMGVDSIQFVLEDIICNE
jgi:single-stranded-DNA-specific exonuclease